MQGNTANPIRELIAQDGVEVSRGTHNDWVLEVGPNVTTAGPAPDPVEVWADQHWETFEVHELPHEKDGWTGYTADRRDSAGVSDE